MNRHDPINSLQLNNHRILYKQIKSIAAINLIPFAFKWHLDLANKPNISLT